MAARNAHQRSCSQRQPRDGEVFVDTGGRLLNAGGRNVAVAVMVLGYIHIRTIDPHTDGGESDKRTVVVTLRPYVGSQLALAALGYALGDLRPNRTIVYAAFAEPQFWAFPGYLPALRKVAALNAGPQQAPAV